MSQQHGEACPPSHSGFGSDLLTQPQMLESCHPLFTLKEDFCPVIALARGSVSWYLARALNHSKRRLNGRKLGNKVIMTLVNLKRSDTAELSHGQWPLACSYLWGAKCPQLSAWTHRVCRCSMGPSQAAKWFLFPLPEAVTLVKLINLFIQHN